MADPDEAQRHHTELADALERYLRESTGLLENVRPRDGFGELLPLVVALKVLRTGRALVVLIRSGYSDEAGSMLRALAAGTISFAALTHASSSDRGYLFARHGRDRHLRWIDSAIERRSVISERERNMPVNERTGLLPLEKFRQIRDHVEAQWNRELDASRAGGPEPAALGNRTGTWSGLSDYDLAVLVGAVDIYRGIYDVASDSVHMLFPNLRGLLKELEANSVATIGGSYESAALVAMGLRDCLDRTLRDATRHFAIADGDARADDLREEVTRAIGIYTEQTGDQAMLARANQLLLNEG